MQDCADRRASACSVFQMTNSGFHAEITLDTANLVFFSVPYDDGFTATVNGHEADILRVDEGLMAVLCPAGKAPSTSSTSPPKHPPEQGCHPDSAGRLRCLYRLFCLG